MTPTADKFREALDAVLAAYEPLMPKPDLLAIAAQFTGALVDAQNAQTQNDYHIIANVLANNLKLGNSAAILKRVTPEGSA